MELCKSPEIVAGLYSLRAGLSLVAQCARNIQRYDLDIDDIEKRRNKLIESESKKKQRLEREINSCRKKITHKEQLINESEKSISDSSKLILRILLELLGSIAVIGGLVCFAIFWFYGIFEVFFKDYWAPFFVNTHNTIMFLLSLTGLDESWQLIIAAVLSCILAFSSWFFALPILFDISSIFSDISMYKNKNKKSKASINVYQREINSLKRELEEKISTFQEIDVPKETKKLNQIAANEKDQYEQKNKQAYINTKMLALATLKALEDVSPIDKRDWANLDIIIYFIETGRADTIKEALAMVDQERRTNAIVTSIQNATIEISKTIKTPINSLQNSLNASFDALRQEISRCRAEISSRMSEISSNISSLNTNVAKGNHLLSQTVSNQRLQSALLGEIATSSEELAKTVSSIKEGGVSVSGKVETW